MQVLREEGHPCNVSQVTAVFRSLEDLGCGKYITGRRGKKSRFRWWLPMISIGQVATGEEVQVEEDEAGLSDMVGVSEEEEASEAEAGDLEDAAWITHTFFLREDVEIQLELPSDLTRFEAKRLSTFIDSLPFDET